MMHSGLTPKKAGAQSTRSASFPFFPPSRPVLRRRARSRGLMVVFGDVALDPEIVVIAFVLRQRAPAASSSWSRGLPGADDDLAEPAHGLAKSEDIIGKRAEIVQDVSSACDGFFYGIRLSANARSSAIDGSRWWHTISISRCSSMVFAGERPRRVGSRTANTFFFRPRDLDDVRRVTRRRRLRYENAWIVRPLNALIVSSTKPDSFKVGRNGSSPWMSWSSATERQLVDRGRRGAPILVQFLARRPPGVDHLHQRPRARGVCPCRKMPRVEPENASNDWIMRAMCHGPGVPGCRKTCHARGRCRPPASKVTPGQSARARSGCGPD